MSTISSHRIRVIREARICHAAEDCRSRGDAGMPIWNGVTRCPYMGLGAEQNGRLEPGQEEI